MKNQWKCFD